MMRNVKLVVGCLLAIGVLLPAPEPASGQPAAARQELPSDLSGPLLLRLREACVKGALRGTRVADCWLDQNQLMLSGLVDQDDQRKLLQDEAQAQINTIPKLRSLATAGVSLKHVTVVPLRSQSLAAIQAALATRRFAGSEWESILRQTRLDDLTFDKAGGLVFHGVCLSDTAKSQMGDDQRPDLPSYRMIIEFEDLLQQQLTPEVYRTLHLSDNRVDIDFLADPTADIQAAVAKRPDLDGVLVREAAFNEKGALTLGGLVGSEGQRSLLREFLLKHLADSRVWRSAADAAEATAGMDSFALNDWRKQVQRELAASDETPWRKTLVARAWFQENGTVAVQLCGLGIEADDEAHQTAFQKLALAVTARLAVDQPAIGAEVRDVVVGSADNWPDPVEALRTATSREPKLDGVRVDGAEFDESGQVVFDGLCGSQAQAEEFRAFAAGALKAARNPLAALPFSTALMRQIPIENLLTDLRTWSSQTLEEVWLTRLFFGADGRLQLQGSSAAEADGDQCRQQVLELLKKHTVAAWLPDTDPVEVKLQIKPGLTPLLRKFVSEWGELRGLSIQRGFYDVKGQYVISGVQDNAQQVGLLLERINAQPAGSALRSRLSGGLKADKFVVVPLTQLVTCLNDVMPAFAVFDEIRLTQAFHDEQNRLAFRGTTTRRDSAAAEKALLNLLKGDPEWGQRVGAGVSLAPLTVLKAEDSNRTEGKVNALVFLISKGDFANARRQLSDAIQQNPKDSVAWYLRGVCYQAENNAHLALRDFMRVHQIEGGERAAIASRARRLSPLGGPRRMQAEKEVLRVGSDLVGQSIDALFGIKAWKARNANK